MAHLELEVPEDVNKVVAEAVSRGEFDSDSEMVTAAVRLWTEERVLRDIGLDQVGRKWDEAIRADGPYLSPDEVLDRLEGKYGALSEPGA